jgi:hypothetical protein
MRHERESGRAVQSVDPVEARAPLGHRDAKQKRQLFTAIALETLPRPYGVGGRLHRLSAGLSGRTLLAGICLAGEWLRLTPKL